MALRMAARSGGSSHNGLYPAGIGGRIGVRKSLLMQIFSSMRSATQGGTGIGVKMLKPGGTHPGKSPSSRQHPAKRFIIDPRSDPVSVDVAPATGNPFSPISAAATAQALDRFCRIALLSAGISGDFNGSSRGSDWREAAVAVIAASLGVNTVQRAGAVSHHLPPARLALGQHFSQKINHFSIFFLDT